MRDFEFQHHDGDDDCQHTITEGFKAILAHGNVVSAPNARSHRPEGATRAPVRCTAELATSLPSCRCSSDLPHCCRVFAMPGSEQHDDRGTGPSDEARKEVWGRASINLYVGHKPRQIELDVVDAVEAITVRVKDPSVCGMVEPRQCDGKRLRGAWIPSQNHVAHLVLERFDVNAPIELMRGHRRTP